MVRPFPRTKCGLPTLSRCICTETTMLRRRHPPFRSEEASESPFPATIARTDPRHVKPGALTNSSWLIMGLQLLVLGGSQGQDVR